MKSNIAIGKPRRLESKMNHKPGNLPKKAISTFGGRG